MEMDLHSIALRIASKSLSSYDQSDGINPFILIAAAMRISGIENVSYVKKTPGKGFCVKSEHNPDWNGGCYPTKAEANKRLEQVEAAKHAKQGGFLGQYDKKFLKPSPKPSPGPYKSDEEARKGLKDNPIPKPPSKPKERTEPVKSGRKDSDPEYKDVDTFANHLYDEGSDLFDHEDLQHLNFRTHTPVRELKAELEGYGLKQVERKDNKKPRGISDNPHGTSPYAGNSGGAAYQSVVDTKYGRNPFEEG